MLKAIDLCEPIADVPLKWSYAADNRIGDHIWWISDTARFEEHYPQWRMAYDVPIILYPPRDP